MFHSIVNFIPLKNIQPSFSKALAAVRVEVDCHHEGHPNFQRAQDLGWRGGWSQKYRVFSDGCLFLSVRVTFLFSEYRKLWDGELHK